MPGNSLGAGKLPFSKIQKNKEKGIKGYSWPKNRRIAPLHRTISQLYDAYRCCKKSRRGNGFSFSLKFLLGVFFIISLSIFVSKRYLTSTVTASYENPPVPESFAKKP